MVVYSPGDWAHVDTLVAQGYSREDAMEMVDEHLAMMEDELPEVPEEGEL